MRQLISLCIAALFASVLGFGPNPAVAVDGPELVADASSGVDFSVLPSERDKLAYLDVRHRQLIERTIRRCTGQHGEVPGGDPSKNPCVVRGVGRELERLGDPQLKAFHHAVPPVVRYNPVRTEMEWQPAVKDRIAETKPLWRQ